MNSQTDKLSNSLTSQYLTAKSAQKKYQKGSVIVVMAFMVSLLATYAVVRMLNQNTLQIMQQEKTMQSLNEAKNALIAWAVSNRDHPGQLPFPDRNGEAIPNYDGTSDCNSPTSVFQYSFLIGQLPVLGRNNPCITPQENISPQLHDAYGNRFWYAVSRNLVHKYELPDGDPIINPSIISNPIYPWLRVVDRNGALISDRVAVVIIAPGNAHAGQNRAGAANINQYLDAVTIGGVPYSNSDYDQPDEDFILAEDMQFVSDSNTTVGRPYLFNDRLVFITIDELISALNKRVAQQAGWLLNSYRTKNGYFPNAADLSVLTFVSNQYFSGPGTQGLLPLDITDSGCTCVSDTSCSCAFNPITSVTMRRDSGTWNSAQDTGSCSSVVAPSGKDCTCTGAGSCARFTTSFVCDATGDCTSTNLTPSANNKFIYKLPEYADFYNPQSGCVAVGLDLECNNAGNFDIGLKEPPWFKANAWQEYMYYRWSAANDLSAGTQVGLTGIIITMGDVITAETGVTQARYSNNLADYLDSIENTDADTQFESVLKQRTNAYNDEVFIISP
jgi:hypothetical protein